MGWTGQGFANKKEFTDSLANGWESKKAKAELLKKSVKGSTLWALMLWTDLETGESEKYIMCYLLRQNARKGYQTEYQYKDMDYGMNPCYYNCPLSYLKEVKFDTEHKIQWKESVEAYWVEQKAKRNKPKPAVGEVWTIVGCKISGQARLTNAVRRSFLGVHVESGRSYKFTRKLLGEKVS